jgi:hypothetical protein
VRRTAVIPDRNEAGCIAGTLRCTVEAVCARSGDLVHDCRGIEAGHDCALGRRFGSGSRVIDYPTYTLSINRTANFFVRFLSAVRFSDITNAPHA